MAVHAREAEKGVLNNVYMCKEVKIGCIVRGWWRDEDVESVRRLSQIRGASYPKAPLALLAIESGRISKYQVQ